LVIAQLGYGIPVLEVTYTAGREFAQVVTFTLRTSQQSIVTLPGDDEAIVITINANKVSDPTENDSIPMGDVRARGFVHTARGLQAVEHLLLVARAHLVARSRAVEITFRASFKESLRARSLRKAILLHDHRLPGAWTVPPPSTFDDKLDFIRGLNGSSAVLAASITNPAGAQGPLILAAGDGPNTDQAKISSLLQTIPTQITVQMKPMEGGPFQQEVVVSVSDLVVPKQIDLEAPSNA
jgi:hypothetical protein